MRPQPHTNNSTGPVAQRFADFPKAFGKITGELDTLLTFYDFPTAHWKHLRTTNPIKSKGSTLRPIRC